MTNKRMAPTQVLILEVLGCRLRLGETIFTFDARTMKSAKELEDANLIHIMSPVVEKTYRASLTEEGLAYALNPAYVPPILSKEWSKDQRKAWSKKLKKRIKNSKQKLKEQIKAGD